MQGYSKGRIVMLSAAALPPRNHSDTHRGSGTSFSMTMGMHSRLLTQLGAGLNQIGNHDHCTKHGQTNDARAARSAAGAGAARPTSKLWRAASAGRCGLRAASRATGGNYWAEWCRQDHYAEGDPGAGADHGWHDRGWRRS